MTLRQLRPLLECLRNIHEIRDLDAFRGYLLSDIPLLIPSEITSFVEVNPGTRKARFWVAPSREFGSHAQQNVWQDLIQEHPVLAYHRRSGDQRAVKLSDLVTRPQLHSMPLYQEHYRGLGVENMMGISLPTSAPLMRGIGLLRGQPDFSEDERLLLNLLRPHLIQGYENAKAVTRLRTGHRLVSQPQEPEVGGVLVLTPDRRVQVASQRAREWITEYFGRQSRGSRYLPEALQCWVAHEQALLSRNQAVPPPREPLIIERDAGRLIIRLLSDVDQSILLLAEQSTKALAPSFEAFGLTRREAEVLAWVVEGKTNAEIGTILGARPRTVAKHLQRIFEKLGVETRMAAAARALNLRIETASIDGPQFGRP